MLVAVDKELYARAEVRAVEGVRLVEGRNNRSWNIEDEAILKKFSICVCFTTPLKWAIFTPLAGTIVICAVWNFINCLCDPFLKITNAPWKHNTGIHFG
jgi:hypothetical protein